MAEVEAKSILQQSGIMANSFTLNPYVGCRHACIYCYACFMRRFIRGHNDEPWGAFADVKINAPDLLEKDFARLIRKGEKEIQRTGAPTPRTIFLSSVTDAYQPLEGHYQVTRGMLERLVRFNHSERKEAPSPEPSLFAELALEESSKTSKNNSPSISSNPFDSITLQILTKSDLVLRDIDLLEQIPNLRVGFSIALMDERYRRILEPGAVSIQRRLSALRQLSEAGIETFVFINPALPYLTPIEEIMGAIRGIATSVFGESLNTGCGNLPRILQAVSRCIPNQVHLFKEAIHSPEFIAQQKERFFRSAKENGIDADGFWDHGVL